ncbi:MAG TPA: STAS domain-containing protein [Labilithrix sp.]|nr:STAS domain-containing protein [Labilithrix sp.]
MSSQFRGFFGSRRARTPSAPPPSPSAPPPSPPPAAREVTPARAMTFTRTDSATECRLRIEGALDLHSAPELRAAFDSVVSASRVVLDLEGLTMIDSSGVGAIVSLFKRVRAAGGTIIVENVQNQPLAVCKVLKLDRVFGL